MQPKDLSSGPEGQAGRRAHYFANGLLKREEHQRPVDNIDEIARTAMSL